MTKEKAKLEVEALAPAEARLKVEAAEEKASLELDAPGATEEQIRLKTKEKIGNQEQSNIAVKVKSGLEDDKKEAQPSAEKLTSLDAEEQAGLEAETQIFNEMSAEEEARLAEVKAEEQARLEIQFNIQESIFKHSFLS